MKAEERGLRVIDAVCPLVTRVHNEAKKYYAEGKKVLLVGHRGHQEVRGTMGQVEMTLVADELDSDLPDWDPSEQVAVLTQTTPVSQRHRQDHRRHPKALLQRGGS